MSSFLFLFGVLNALTPVLMLSTSDSLSNYSAQQRVILRNMFVCGVWMVIIAIGLFVWS